MGMTEQATALLQKFSPKAKQILQENPQILKQAQEMASKYGNDKNALKQALPLIKQMGGVDVVNRAMQKLNANPLAKIALNKMLGVNVDNVAKELEQPQKTMNTQPQTKATNSFKDKLKKYQ